MRVLFVITTLAVAGAFFDSRADSHLYGALQSSVARAAEGRAAGWSVAVISVAWDAFEPREGEVNMAYVTSLREQMKAYRGLGYRLQLDTGLQYPPGWLFQLPNSRFLNQFGETYGSSEPGKRMVNFVFNQALRDRAAAYLGKVFDYLGTDWDWVRLGGGLYNEVNYPQHSYHGKTNCYWAFDDLAQGRSQGRPAGVPVCPVPGWVPGAQAPRGEEASLFLDWYFNALRDWHDWQITTVRKSYSGEICMLYGSWGIRPGDIAAAVATGLAGTSPVERVGELQAGYDWARIVGGIQDPKVIVYCTWVDAPAKDCQDDGSDVRRWSPVHWLADLARKNPLRLRVWGENTGNGNSAALALTFERVQVFDLMGVLWAFEADLFASPNPGHLATFDEFAAEIRKHP